MPDTKHAGPSPCDFDPCIGEKMKISCDQCGAVIYEVRDLDAKGWDGVLIRREARDPHPRHH